MLLGTLSFASRIFLRHTPGCRDYEAFSHGHAYFLFSAYGSFGHITFRNNFYVQICALPKVSQSDRASQPLSQCIVFFSVVSQPHVEETRDIEKEASEQPSALYASKSPKRYVEQWRIRCKPLVIRMPKNLLKIELVGNVLNGC